MTAQPLPETDRPFWTVQAVFDPDGNGGDFAYTIGLFTHECPELHLWARPSLGEDPGADWKFSMRDCGRILNELAFKLLRGELDVGSTFSSEYDRGLVRVDFRVDPPGDRDQLEAFGIAPGALVLPVRWSLHRAPEGDNLPLTADEVRRAAADYAALTRRVDLTRQRPPGWELRAEPSFDPAQRFGPLTPLVLARAAQLTDADAATLSAFVGACVSVDLEGILTWPASVAASVARTVGRAAACEAARHAADELVAGWRGDPGTRTRWLRVVDRWWNPADAAERGVSREGAQRNVESVVRDGICSLLVAQVVQDVLDTETWLEANGPWAAATSPDGRPGPGWYAPPDVLRTVRRLFSRLSATRLWEIAFLHRAFTDDTLPPVGQDRRYQELEHRLLAWATTSAAGCPPAHELFDGLAVGKDLAERRRLLGLTLNDEALSRWLDCLTSAIVHRARLSDADVGVFTSVVQHVLPGLSDLLARR